MIVKIKNYGVIGTGEIDTSKPLILMCGPNSTGKTYMSYLLYAVFSSMFRMGLNNPYFDEIKKSVDKEGRFILKKEYLDEALRIETEAVKNTMDSIFGLSPDITARLFRNTRIDLSITDEFYREDIFLSEIHVNSSSVNGEHTVILQKDANSYEVKFEIKSTNDQVKLSELPVWEYLIYSALRFGAHTPVFGARMLTVERNSIYTFNKELSLSRNELIDKLLEVERKDGQDLFELLNSQSRRYPLAVRDSLRVSNDLENIQKHKSPYFEFASEIESGLLHGTIGVNKTGSVEFIPETGGKQVKRLPIHMASSIVKTLSSLIIYLKHIANKDDLLIIDEPEMNLHPNNQIVLARLFARMVNNGLRLVISTHSDYIIREFNNLVMAHELFCVRKSGPEENLGHEYAESEYLDRNRLDVLYFDFDAKGKVRISNVDIDEYGFNVKSIDDTINSQNDVTQALFDSLRYGGN